MESTKNEEVPPESTTSNNLQEEPAVKETPKVSTEIEIAAPPQVVRSKFLDFSTILKYQRPSSYITAFEVEGGKAGLDLEPGDVMNATLGGMNMTLVVVENNETTFSWYGAWPSERFKLLSGVHSFKFLPSVLSTSSALSTRLLQEEEHQGLLAGVMKFEAAYKKANDGNMAFNEDLKKWVESDS